ncbi:MAG: TonB-dependent receptor [Holophagales bacterium]|nr:TonB-dependent receptor [Holophagales bacterium]MYG31124.1 TonB-dependent receptor [Holophagales bacterium]MYI79393.1 TonB-dependent receptor [Holophagales bacterium]
MICTRTITLRPALSTALLLFALVLAGCASEAPEDSGGDAASAPEAVPTEPLGSSSIAGSVRFEGELPNLPALNMDADPACAAKHSGPVYPEILAVDDQAGLANVLVYVADNVPQGPYPPAEPPVIDQQGCRYTPRVAGIMVGQELKVLNSDELLHNVHSLSEVNRPFNRAMPAAIKQATFSFTDEEPAFRIKCDVHPWMSSYVGVFSHPYFAVSGPDGSFEIPGLPAGTYTIEAWHERLGTMRSGVTLLDGLTATVDLTFSLPE